MTVEQVAALLRPHEFKAVGSPGLELFMCRCGFEFTEPGEDGYYGGPYSLHLADTLFAAGVLLPTDYETKALVETATRLGRELGRREAAEEAAKAIEDRSLDGTWNMGGQICLRIAARIAREIATKEPK